MQMKNVFRALGGLTLILAGCGGSDPPAKQPEPDPTPVRRKNDNVVLRGEFGTIDEQAVNKVLDTLMPKFGRCQSERQPAIKMLSGSIKFYILVTEEGTTKTVYLEGSDLGDRDTEKCLMGVIEGARFPNAEGGPAIVRYPLQLDKAPEVRAATPWDPSKVEKAVEQAGRCGASGAQVTAYVVPDGKGGKAIAVGVAIPQKDADEKIDCVVKAVKETKLPTPGGYVAKVSFTL